MPVAPQLSALEAAGLIRLTRIEPEFEYAFRHVLVQQAAYHSLLKNHRRALHQAVGETLEHAYPTLLPELAPVLGQHFLEAGDQPRAARYFAQAAEAAARAYANMEAVAYYSHAIEASRVPPAERGQRSGYGSGGASSADAQPSGDITAPPLAELLRARGLARELLGDFDGALADLQAALESATTSGEQRAEWQVLINLALLWAGRDYARSGDYCRRAYDLARAMNDPLLIAHSLNRLANWHLNVEQTVEAGRLHRQALSIFETIPDQAGLADTLDLLGMTSLLGNDLDQSVRYYDQALQSYRALGNRMGEANALAGRLTCAGGHFNTRAMRPSYLSLTDMNAEAASTLQLMRSLGWRAGEAFVLLIQVCYWARFGEYATALTCARAAVDLSTDIGHHQWMAGSYHVLGMTYLDLLSAERAVSCLERGLELARMVHSAHWIGYTAGVLASAHLALGDVPAARAVLESTGAPPRLPQSSGERYIAISRAELSLADGRLEDALRAIDLILSLAAPQAPGQPPATVPYCSLLRGRVLAALGRPADAEAELRACIQTTETYTELDLLWPACRELGRLLASQGQSEAAAAQFARARAIVTGIAARIPDADLRETFLRRAEVGAEPG